MTTDELGVPFWGDENIVQLIVVMVDNSEYPKKISLSYIL